jgi:hypothetical protein
VAAPENFSTQFAAVELALTLVARDTLGSIGTCAIAHRRDRSH